MALRDILTYPDPRLVQKADLITDFHAGIDQLAQDMLETMLHANGIGLAAPQVGIMSQVIAVSVPRGNEPRQDYVLCNPRVIEGGGKAMVEEACLSLPGFFIQVPRYEKIRLQAKTPKGKDVSLEAQGLLSICIQHEIDHLDGRLLVHHASSLKRGMYRKKQIKLKKKVQYA